MPKTWMLWLGCLVCTGILIGCQAVEAQPDANVQAAQDAQVAKQPVSALPYPPSEVIADVIFDWDSHEVHAPGSDNWSVTWAADDHLYATWGDGGGFGGTNGRGRVSLGIGRVEGSWDDYKGVNIWGGYQAENPATFEGKSYGILALDGILYLWVSPGSNANNYRETRLHWSTDNGASWTAADWAFTQEDLLVLPAFLQFGRDYAGARDEYVYLYAIRLSNPERLRVQKPGMIDLLRVPKEKLRERASYEFFAGLDKSGEPVWTDDLEKREPVFSNADGVGWTVSVSYNAGLDRYLLMTEHSVGFKSHLGMFDAPEPWGPWTTVVYEKGWDGPETVFYWNFANKWLSKDGLEFSLIFSGVDESDSWNSVRGRFELVEAED